MDGGKTILSFWDILTFQGKCLLNFRGLHHFDFPNIFCVRSLVIGAQKHQPGPPNQRRVHRWYRKDDRCPTVMNHVLHPLEGELSTLEETKINEKITSPHPNKRWEQWWNCQNNCAFLGDSRIRRMEGYANDTMMNFLFLSVNSG